MTNIFHVDDVQARLTGTIKLHPVVLFMKGSPSLPQYGFSAAIVQTPVRYRAPFHAVDMVADPQADRRVCQAIETFSDWPTLPQLCVGGAFIGGCDIVLEMHKTGEFAEALSIHRAAAAS